MIVVSAGNPAGQTASVGEGHEPSGPTPAPNRSKAPSGSTAPAAAGTTTVTWFFRDAAPATERVTNDTSDSGSFQVRLTKRVVLSVFDSIMGSRGRSLRSRRRPATRR